MYFYGNAGQHWLCYAFVRISWENMLHEQWLMNYLEEHSEIIDWELVVRKDE